MIPIIDDRQQHGGFSSPAQMVQKMTDSAQSALQVISSVAGPMSPSQNDRKRKTRSSADDSSMVMSSDENETIEESPLKRVKFSDR